MCSWVPTIGCCVNNVLSAGETWPYKKQVCVGHDFQWGASRVDMRYIDFGFSLCGSCGSHENPAAQGVNTRPRFGTT